MSFLRSLFGPRRPKPFDQELLEALRADPRVSRVQRDEGDPGLLFVDLVSGVRQFVNTENGCYDFNSVPVEEKAAVVARWVELAVAGGEAELTLASAGGRLFPVVRSDDMPTLNRLQFADRLQAPLPAPPFLPVAPGVIALLAIDHPTRIQYVDEKTLSGWGTTIDAAYSLALENLAAATPRPPRRLDNGFFGSDFDDSYDVSRVLLKDWVENAPVGPDRFVAIPCRANLWVTSRDRLPALFAVAERSFCEDPYPVSCQVFRWVEGELLELGCEKDDSLVPLVRRSKVIDLAKRYGDQKPHLESLLRRQQKDIFVASHSVFQQKSGRLVSRCVWGKGVATLLPKADEIAFVEGEATEPVLVPWELACEVVNHRMADWGDLKPPRWSVETYPSPEELKELRSRQV